MKENNDCIKVRRKQLYSKHLIRRLTSQWQYGWVFLRVGKLAGQSSNKIYILYCTLLYFTVLYFRPEQFNFLFFEPAKLRFSKIGKKKFKSIPAKTENKERSWYFHVQMYFFVLVRISR